MLDNQGERGTPVHCLKCDYKWVFKATKRPDPRKCTCPNCEEPVLLRDAKI